jgi:primosomal protein N'
MYISVIPLRHSLSKYPYIYFVPEIWQKNLKVGYLVEIPLGKHIAEGIICERDVLPGEDIDESDIRSIIAVIATVEILAPYMLTMIRDIADQYFLLIHKVASFFVPRSLLSHLDKRNYIITGSDSTLENNRIPNRNKASHTEIHHFMDTIFSVEDI